MKNHFICLALLISNFCYCQTDQSRINQLNEISTGGHNQMLGRSLPPPEIKGSTFYSDNWFPGNVHFSNGKKLDDLFIKFDIASGIIKTKKDERTLAYKGEDILAFQWLNNYTGLPSVFRNCKGYSLSDTELNGFFEVILNDEVSLFSHTTIKMKSPDYVEGLDVGNRDYEIRKVEEYYLAFNKRLVELKKGKHIRELKHDIPEIKAYIKTNKLSFKNRSDLIAITKYLNTLNTSEWSF